MSVVVNWSHITLCEEVMLNLERDEVENADQYSAIDVFIMTSLDVKYIFKMITLNLKESLIDPFTKPL